MRIIKDPEERRTDILDAASRLFVTKGYGKTTIIDILEALGISKGAFYHYYKSKEEVLDAVIARIVAEDVVRAKAIAASTELDVFEKIFGIFTVQQPRQGDLKHQMAEQFHETANAQMHQKSISKSILGLSPVINEVIQEGIRQGVLKTPYGHETIEFLLAGSAVIFDDGFFRWTPEELKQRASALVYMMEKLLGAPEHAFDFVFELLKVG